jgi:hypothetical protein
MPCPQKGLPEGAGFCRSGDLAQNGKEALILVRAVTRTSKIPYRLGLQMSGIFNRNRVVYLDNGEGYPVSA